METHQPIFLLDTPSDVVPTDSMQTNHTEPCAVATYKDPSQPIEKRVADLLARMTLAEKFAQMHGYWMVLSETGDHRLRTDNSNDKK